MAPPGGDRLSVDQVAATIELPDVSSLFNAEMRLMDAECPVPLPPWAPSLDEYHADPSISSTSLKVFREDREEFQRRLLCRLRGEPVAEDRPPSWLSLGGALHGAFLDRQEHDIRRAELQPSDVETLRQMVASIREAPLDVWAGRIRRYLTTVAGQSEWSYRFIDPGSGMPVRVRCDRLIGWRGENRLTIFELKTSRRTDPSGFRRDVRDFGYYHQLALQEDGVRTAFPGVEVASLWGFVSTTRPFPAVIFQPDRGKLDEARQMNREHLAELSGLMVNEKTLLTPWGPRRQPWEAADAPMTA